MDLKKGISVWAFPSEWPLNKCFELAREAGFDGIELAYHTNGPITPETPSEELKRIKQECSNRGLEVSSLASGIFWEVNLLSEDSEENGRAKFHVTRMLEIASDMELPTILVVPGFIGPFEAGPAIIKDYEQAYNRGVASFQELAPTAERLGVSIGVENVWNKFLGSPMEMRSFLDEVGSPFVGSYFDVGNCLRTGYPEHWIRILGKRIKAVHFKDFRVNIGSLQAFVDLLEGDVNYPAVMEALADIGYSGYCVVEVFARPLVPKGLVLRAGMDIQHIFEGWNK
jgi:L-ribulose-5-phosphate 3-epimerase